MIVRPMEVDDVEAVVAIEEEAFTTPWQRETFLGLLERDGIELLVMTEADALVVGYAVLWCILDQGELSNVAVAPSRRGTGLGRRLLAEVLETARRRGVESIYLEVRDSNAVALALYRSFGFIDVGLRKDYYDDPKEDARLMLKRL